MRRVIPLFILLIGLQGCTTFSTGPPETPRQQLAAAEISFKALLEQATLNKPQMTKAQVVIIDRIVTEMVLVFNSAHEIVKRGGNLSDWLGAIQNGLRRLRIALQEKKDAKRSLGGAGNYGRLATDLFRCERVYSFGLQSPGRGA